MYFHARIFCSTTPAGGTVVDVTPADLAATNYRRFDVPLDATYLDNRGRPRFIVDYGGKPIREL